METAGWILLAIAALAFSGSLMERKGRMAGITASLTVFAMGAGLLYATGAADRALNWVRPPGTNTHRASTAADPSSTAAAQPAPTPPAPPSSPLSFLAPLPPLPTEWVNALPEAQRQPVQQLHAICAAWAAAATRAEQERIEADARQAMPASPERAPWVGAVMEHNIRGDVAAVTIAVAPGVTVGTNDVGWISSDSADTWINRGSRDFAAISELRRNGLVSFRAHVFRPMFIGGRCAFLARITQIRGM